MYKNEALYRFFSRTFASSSYGMTKVGSERWLADEEKKKSEEASNNLFCGNSKFRYVCGMKLDLIWIVLLMICLLKFFVNTI